MTARVTTPEQRARYREASTFVLRFGKHEGKALDVIGTSDLRYLVWLRESMSKGVRHGDKGSVTYEMLCRYLADPDIADAASRFSRER